MGDPPTEDTQMSLCSICYLVLLSNSINPIKFELILNLFSNLYHHNNPPISKNCKSLVPFSCSSFSDHPRSLSTAFIDSDC